MAHGHAAEGGPLVSDSLAAAYSATGAAWQLGPALIYDRLAEVVVGRSPRPLHGCSVLDIGAGTGAAGRAAARAGARSTVAVDAALGMLLVDAGRRPPAVAGDALRLPFAAGSFDASVAAFSLNHLPEPAAGLRETARVTRIGGAIVAASHSADDSHPVKAAVEAALTTRGWAGEAWYAQLRDRTTPKLATVEGCRAVADAAGLDAEVEAVRVPFPDLGPRELVAWRLGMAQHAPFLAGLASDDERAAVVRDAIERLGDDPPPLERSILVLRSVRT
jgi:SAM-dependent methyltransferase